jgi:GNAT superfamily N-acetyltransferase
VIPASDPSAAPVPPIRKVRPEEAVRMAGLMARSFAADPMLVHLLPDAASRPARLAEMFRVGLERLYLRHEQCYVIGDFLGGVIWLPPGTHPPPFWRQLALLPDFARVFGHLRWPRAFLDIERMESLHPRQPPHWYLPFLGIEPSVQGQGLSGPLIRHALDICDAQKLPAYAETSVARNVRHWARFGFNVVRERAIPHGPHLWAIWREPMAAGR